MFDALLNSNPLISAYAELLNAQFAQPVGKIEARTHGNSYLSMRETEVYYLINNNTGGIDKIGITSNAYDRYSDSYLRAQNVTYQVVATYSYRYPAVVDENIRLFHYNLQHGRLPRLNKSFR